MKWTPGTTVTGCALALACLTGTATAQTSGSAIANPNYVTIPLEIDVDRPDWLCARARLSDGHRDGTDFWIGYRQSELRDRSM